MATGKPAPPQSAAGGHKIGTPRTVTPTDEAVAVPRGRPVYFNSDYMFCTADGSRYGKLTRGLAGAARRAGIEDLRWHDLRRTCGSWLLQDGASMEVVKNRLGHKSMATTERSCAFLNIANLHVAAHLSAQSARIGSGQNG